MLESGRGRWSMPPAIASLTTRLFDASSSRGQRCASRVWLGCISRRSRSCSRPRSRPVPQLAFMLSWGFFNFCWIVLFAPPGGRRRDLARLARAADPAVAVQARGAADDGQFRRPDGDRQDTFSFLMQGFSRARAQGRARDRAHGRLALVLIWYFDPFRVRRGTAAARRGIAALRGWSRWRSRFPNDPWEEFYARIISRSSRAPA